MNLETIRSNEALMIKELFVKSIAKPNLDKFIEDFKSVSAIIEITRYKHDYNTLMFNELSTKQSPENK
tara:strand:+ start:5097 stop:5300 length:204 start_codon:yes stop_codon:yes gene_type:complete